MQRPIILNLCTHWQGIKMIGLWRTERHWCSQMHVITWLVYIRQLLNARKHRRVRERVWLFFKRPMIWLQKVSSIYSSVIICFTCSFYIFCDFLKCFPTGPRGLSHIFTGILCVLDWTNVSSIPLAIVGTSKWLPSDMYLISCILYRQL